MLQHTLQVTPMSFSLVEMFGQERQVQPYVAMWGEGIEINLKCVTASEVVL